MRCVKTIKYYVCQTQVSDGRNPDFVSQPMKFFSACQTRAKHFDWKGTLPKVSIHYVFIFGCIDWCQGFGAIWHIIFFPRNRKKRNNDRQKKNCQCFLHGTMNTKHISQMRTLWCVCVCVCVYMWSVCAHVKLSAKMVFSQNFFDWNDETPQKGSYTK